VWCSNRGVIDYIDNDTPFSPRPVELDASTVSGYDLYRAFAEKFDADVYVCVHATAPFLKPSSYRRVVERVVSGEAQSAYTVVAARTQAICDGKGVNWDCNKLWFTNILSPVWLLTQGCFAYTRDMIMGGKYLDEQSAIIEVSSIEAIDIDYQADYDLACAVSKGLGLA
jgi:CMP-N-acetylneuraminic acid synthetase